MNRIQRNIIIHWTLDGQKLFKANHFNMPENQVMSLFNGDQMVEGISWINLAHQMNVPIPSVCEYARICFISYKYAFILYFFIQGGLRAIKLQDLGTGQWSKYSIDHFNFKPSEETWESVPNTPDEEVLEIMVVFLSHEFENQQPLYSNDAQQQSSVVESHVNQPDSNHNRPESMDNQQDNSPTQQAEQMVNEQMGNEPMEDTQIQEEQDIGISNVYFIFIHILSIFYAYSH